MLTISIIAHPLAENNWIPQKITNFVGVHMDVLFAKNIICGIIHKLDEKRSASLWNGFYHCWGS